jgi:hypothetical protein
MSTLTRTSRSLVAAALVSALALAGAHAAGAHDGDHHQGSGAYEPPPVETPPRQAPGRATVAPPFAHEVWLLDQSNTGGSPTVGWGGVLHIYDGAALRSSASTAVPESIDLAGAATELCQTSTGANPTRPHMIAFNADQTHAIVSFVVSGHVLILDAPTREPVACFRTEAGAGGARQAHAAIPTPDQRFILVANQNGKKLERISTDYRTNTFAQQPAATLDLAAGTTPNGFPVQSPSDEGLRPDNAPICPFVPSSGYPVFISLRGGGMLAADPNSTPMEIVAEYPATVVARDGCGFVEASGWVYGNGGSRPANPAGWFIYRVPAGPSSVYSPTNPVNSPAAQLVAQDTRGPRDAHGVVATGNGRYVWFFDRAADVAEVYDARTGTYRRTVNLQSPHTGKPTTDIVDISPDGRFLYAATRGPNPLSGAHAARGESPGVLVLEVLGDGSRLAVRGHSGVTNPALDSTVERADPHGLAVRHTGTRPGR